MVTQLLTQMWDKKHDFSLSVNSLLFQMNIKSSESCANCIISAICIIYLTQHYQRHVLFPRTEDVS